ncbi:hypothetical protein K227x_40900 [Rubripirellula lacrimiformis]|uniref:DUF1552 domain-containing protein n=1 Tax=Rubripirellula lacrimiformis TaxID=1930273 RepID=A0A517NEY6_9BACT|nr:DUF1552 domain-containing protein [Rubripirellula lacrimiformis]QDT05687.1 hypothetical protein K227x_40900 [Rubripirellula lacrimiformis]
MLIPANPISRRKMLRGATAAAIALPMLEAMGPSVGRRALGQTADDVPPKRFVACCAGLGFHGPHLFPDAEGDALASTPYLSRLADHHDQITVFSGLSHPDQQGNNGHASALTWLTSARRPGLAGFRNTLSIDQRIAQQVGLQTRFPFLAMAVSNESLSWTSNGVPIPAMSSPAKIYKALFVDGDAKAVDKEMLNLKRGRSILDTVGGRARRLEQKLGERDRDKLDEYLTSVRELEQRLQQSEGWVRLPKPKVDIEQPDDIRDKAEAIARQRLMYDMIVLAIQTDSTRTITHQLGGLNSAPNIPGVDSDWHGLSHHGKDPDKINELKLIEEAEFETFNEFLTKLRAIDEGGRSLLDQTAILFGSNLGNASAHDWRNLPIIIAGGGYNHGRYVAHDSQNNTPFANVLVSLAQRMDVEIDSFGSSTAAGVRGLDQS